MELEPITRKEKIIAGQDLTPITRMEKFLKEYGGSGGGSSGAEEFKVTFTTDSSGAYVADKTHSEIFDAYIAGKKVYGMVVIGTNDFFILTLGGVSGDEASFYAVVVDSTEGSIFDFSIPRIGAGVHVRRSQLSFATIQ